MWAERARRSSAVQLSSASWASRARRRTSSAVAYAPLERRLLIRVSRSGGTLSCMAVLRCFHLNVLPWIGGGGGRCFAKGARGWPCPRLRLDLRHPRPGLKPGRYKGNGKSARFRKRPLHGQGQKKQGQRNGSEDPPLQKPGQPLQRAIQQRKI